MTMLIITGMLFSCINKKAKLAKLMMDPEYGLIQTKRWNNKTVVMELLPHNRKEQPDENADNRFYKVKLTLISNEQLKGNAMMQYMNFDIKNSFYAVQGNDTLPCVICERIPGISGKEFLYMACFAKEVPKMSCDNSLHVCIADTIAGFGTMAFEIKTEALRKLEVIK